MPDIEALISPVGGTRAFVEFESEREFAELVERYVAEHFGLLHRDEHYLKALTLDENYENPTSAEMVIVRRDRLLEMELVRRSIASKAGDGG